MINNGMSWLSLGNYINPKTRNTELSNDYNQLTNRPIITLTGTSQNPIKLWKLDVGLYILNGYVQHTDALLSEARGLFVSATVGIVDGKYVISAFIPFWEGQYEYILPSLSSETYTEHQMIRMITQGNSLTLDNIREYFPTQDYHPTTKKYVDETMDAIRNELGKMGLNNNDVQSLIKENRRRDIAIQALLSQNSDKMVTIDEEVHNISMDYSLDNGIATINTLEGDTLVNVSKDTEYDKVLTYEQDIVENTNTVDLEIDGNLNPIIVGDTLVNVCTQNNPTAITNEYTVEGNNHFALQDEVEGNCRPIIQGNTIVNYCTNGSEELTLNNEINAEGTNVTLTDTVDNGKVDVVCKGNTLVNLYDFKDRNDFHSINNKVIINGKNLKFIADGTYQDAMLKPLSTIKPNTIYTIIVNIIKNTLIDGCLFVTNSSDDANLSRANFVVMPNMHNRLVGTVTTKSDLSNDTRAMVTFLNKESTQGEIEVNIVVLEGDWTDKEIPSYFEGMKSVGECEDNKVEILSYPKKDYITKTMIPYQNQAKPIFHFADVDTKNQGCAISSELEPYLKYFNNCGSYEQCNNLFDYYRVTEGYWVNLGVWGLDNTARLKSREVINKYIGKCEGSKKEIQLSEPLRGISDEVCDKFVKQGGKWYVERNCGEVIIDGSSRLHTNVTDYPSDNAHCILTSKLNNLKINDNIVCDKLLTYKYDNGIWMAIVLGDKNGISTVTNDWGFAVRLTNDLTSVNKTDDYNTVISKFRTYLQSNPITVVYQLETPTYEEITDPQVITYLDTTHISNNSTIPCNMQVKNSGYNAIIKPSTQYTIALNANINKEINVDLGGTEVTTTNNVITITTPSTLINENLMLYGKNVVINNAMLFEGDMTSNLPSKYIEGLKSSFEDGYIPSEDYGLKDITVLSNTAWKMCANTLIEGNTYTVFAATNGNNPCQESIVLISRYLPTSYIEGVLIKKGESVGVRTFVAKSSCAYVGFNNPSESDIVISPIILEGDWTHLHLTEEDLNHLGQYKVEYKVIGKNKFNPHLCSNPDFSINKNGEISYLNPNDGRAWNYRLSEHKFRLKKGNYKLTITCIQSMSSAKSYRGYNLRTKDDIILRHMYGERFPYQAGEKFTTDLITLIEDTDLGLMMKIYDGVYTVLIENVTDGVTIGEYEPYKESIQTVYLNSPLLQGDTIEEIDGEVYHVHRYDKVVLDGSKNSLNNELGENNDSFCILFFNSNMKKNNRYVIVKCDTLQGNPMGVPKPLWVESRIDEGITFANSDSPIIVIRLKKNRFNKDFSSLLIGNKFQLMNQWLSQNPTTVVYELATPTYELIPSSSIVCKSYPNGHLDFDTNVHIDNTVNFVKANLPITYANASTNYKLQFVSDKDMENVTINVLGNIMENVTITKGLNKISFTSPSDATNILTFEGIGYAYISNVQLVATDKDIDYFKGLYSTYECGLIEDESNENYGKYEVNIVSYNAPIQFGKGGKIE